MAKRTRPLLSSNALTVLESRYLLKDDHGKVTETPEEMFGRVAHAVAEAEERDRKKWAERFYDEMASLRFVPNSPTLMNAGKPQGQLSACFVLPVHDSLDSIFDTLKHAAKIHQSGGGTGFSFSELRPAGSRVKTTLGVASGPVSFIRIYDSATETIKQGGARRGANMGILRVDHPDIFEFIDAKRDQRSILNFNLSVAITDEFMNALESESGFELRDPSNGETVRTVGARELFDRMVESAWECGDPGLVFLDRINRFNPTPQIGPMVSTNPCGEQPLLPFESCNLGSVDLGKFAHGGEFDWEGFRETVRLGVRFLDDVVDVNVYPIDECAKITRRNRKIGLGVMGLADALLKLGIGYDTDEGRAFGERVMSFLSREGRRMSAELAQKRGAFANWNGSMWKRLGYPKLRNATVTTVAPTGTISIIAGASSGIEPIFSAVFYRNVLSGKRLMEVHPAVSEVLGRAGMDVGSASEEQIEEALREELGAAWRPASQVAVDDHVRMQAVFQRHSDSAVSKTINLPESASRADVERAYRFAYASGCKGITVYRDRSRESQVLETQRAPRNQNPGVREHCAVCE